MKMSHHNWQARNKRELIIEVWEQLDCDSVGTGELARIQDELREMFGEGAVDSPAAIARVLIDEGATLRHPEVVTFDVNWRHSQMEQVAATDDLDFLSLPSAADALIQMAQRWRTASRNEQDALRQVAGVWSREADLLSASVVVDEQHRLIAHEIRSWIGLWMQNPELFEDWLSLRLRAPEFLLMFGELLRREEGDT